MSGERIFIVEDEAIQGMAAKDVLVKDGYDVMPVPFTGEEAIELIEQSPPDLAIIDITLGDEIDGIQVSVTGGVAANSELRSRMEIMCGNNKAELYLPPLEYCTDNAAMIALAGYRRFLKGELASMDLNPKAHLPL